MALKKVYYWAVVKGDQMVVKKVVQTAMMKVAQTAMLD